MVAIQPGGKYPGFVDYATQNYRLKETATALIDAGVNYTIGAYGYDLDSTVVPQNIIMDIGAYEYFDGAGSINYAPNIDDQLFNLPENSGTGVLVATVVASDPDAGQTLTFSITSGNTDNAFSIDPISGNLSVNNASVINFEQTPSFGLTVTVQDDAASPLSNSATITVNLTDVNENPEINNQVFGVAENTNNGQSVGTVVATDPDNGQNLSYTILSGNTSGAFSLNATSGQITVANSAALNFESTPVFALIVKVTDDGAGSLFDQASVTINLTYVNENPDINNQMFVITENTANGQTVGTVVATDPDNRQSLSFSIQSGNTNGAFSLNSTSGHITVANSVALDFESTPVFYLLVTVTDNGAGSLSDQATISINLTDVNEAPVMVGQGFTIDENMTNGSFVGQVIANDPDNGQSLTYSILNGNTENAFVLDVNTGEFTIGNELAINFETNPNFVLNIRATDNGLGNLWTDAQMIIVLFDINEPPVITLQDYTVNVNGLEFLSSNQNNRIYVGDILAVDPDAGQELTYNIVKCSDNELWTLNELTGELEILNPGRLSPVEINNYCITVEVSDDHISPITCACDFVIHVNISNVEAFGEFLENNLTGVNNSILSKSFRITPNPASDQIRITMDLEQEEPIDVSIYALNGNRVLSSRFDSNDSDFNEILSINNLESGLYMVRVRQGEKTQTAKLVKK